MSVNFDEDDLPYSTLYGDHYFSRIDGLAECDHVFLGGNCLPERWQQNREPFVVGELGFGTGLNFLQTWSKWRDVRTPDQHLTFISAEAHLMVREKAVHALSRWPELAEKTGQLIEVWGQMDQDIMLDAQTCLRIIHGDVTMTISGFPQVDAWYLDGFSPAKNPDMWSAELMQALYDHTNIGGTFASYTAAGWVRRNLETAGFSVKKEPGFGTKRHMISGAKL